MSMRLFAALPLPDELGRVLLRAQDELRARGVRANFSREENLHLTLAFLGETERVRAAQEAVLSLRAGSFDLTLAGWGCFGDLLWAGVRGSRALDGLAARVRAALDGAGLSCDRKPFRPHITLARRVRPGVPDGFSIPARTGRAERVTLFSSTREDGRLVYTPVAESRLR